MCVIGLGVLVCVNGRIETLADRVETSVEELATTLDRTAVALDDASTTADSFTVTIDNSEEAVYAAANTIMSVRTNLETLESVLRAVNILGVSPLGPAADAVGGIANAIEGLDTRLSAIGDSLDGNSDALAANATSLGRLADSTAAAAERLRSGVIEDSLDDVHLVIIVVLLMMLAWTAVPAVGALVFGVWLRRELARRPRVSAASRRGARGGGTSIVAARVMKSRPARLADGRIGRNGDPPRSLDPFALLSGMSGRAARRRGGGRAGLVRRRSAHRAPYASDSWNRTSARSAVGRFGRIRAGPRALKAIRMSEMHAARPGGHVGDRQRRSWRSADRAASIPHMPWTPPPGGVDDEHRYSPCPTWYGSRDGHGRKMSWRMSWMPPLMSPPT